MPDGNATGPSMQELDREVEELLAGLDDDQSAVDDHAFASAEKLLAETDEEIGGGVSAAATMEFASLADLDEALADAVSGASGAGPGMGRAKRQAVAEAADDDPVDEGGEAFDAPDDLAVTDDDGGDASIEAAPEDAAPGPDEPTDSDEAAATSQDPAPDPEPAAPSGAEPEEPGRAGSDPAEHASAAAPPEDRRPEPKAPDESRAAAAGRRVRARSAVRDRIIEVATRPLTRVDPSVHRAASYLCIATTLAAGLVWAWVLVLRPPADVVAGPAGGLVVEGMPGGAGAGGEGAAK